MPHKILEFLKRIVENLIVYIFQVDKMAFYIHFMYVCITHVLRHINFICGQYVFL